MAGGVLYRTINETPKYPETKVINHACDFDRALPSVQSASRPARLVGLDAAAVEDVYEPVAAWIQREVANRDGPFLLGVNGAQGSGKSTFAH